MAARVEKLISLRNRLQADLKHHIETLNTFDADTGNGTIRVRIKAATSTYQQFENNWSQLEADAKYEDRSSSGQQLINRNLSDAYLKAIGHAEDFLPLATHASFQANSTTNFQDPPQPRTAATKLPPITIQPFDGVYDNWEQFRDTFVACFSSAHTKYDNVQKLLYLKGLLSEEPLTLIKSLKTTNENFALAWEILDTRYSNKRKIAYAHFNTISELPAMTKESIQEIRSLLDVSNASLSAIRSQHPELGLLDQYLVFMLSRKLDKESRRHWEEHLNASHDLPDYAKFKQFLEIRLNILENIELSAGEKVKEKPASKSPTTINKSNAKAFHTFGKKAPQCSICNKEHRPFECPQIKSVIGEERWKLAQSKALCINCLYQHDINACKSKYRCVVCGQKHNSILHMDASVQPTVTPSTSSSGQSEQKTFHAYAAHKRQALLATARVIVRTPAGSNIILRALIDQGSSINLISEHAAQLLRVKRSKCETTLITVGDSNSIVAKHQASINIGSLYTAYRDNIDVIVVPKITNMAQINRTLVSNLDHLSGLDLADPEFYEEGAIDLLIGVEVLASILLEGLKRGPPCTPIAQNSHLGWIISGSISANKANSAVCFVTRVETHDKQDNLIEIEDRLKAMWELADLAPRQFLSHDDERCEDLFATTTIIAPDNRYMVRLPFKIDPLSPDFLGDSYSMALRRLLSFERSMSQKPELAKAVDDYFKAYIDAGHLRPATDEELQDGNRCYFMPHHAVFKGTSTTTKVRVVFDASAKSSNGFSLNDRLLVGPKIQTDISIVLLRWRAFKVAFTADITKMYLQFWVHPEDARFQRILLRVNGEIMQFISHTVTFGTASAPFHAVRSLHLLASECENSSHMVAKLLRNNFYIDDCAGGADTEMEAIDNYRQLTQVLLSRGLHLRKWASNSQNLLNEIPVDHRETSQNIEINSRSIIKSLGLYWDPVNDTFHYTLNLPQRGSIATKRSLISDFSSLFDPLGWLSPALIIPKIIYQDTWLRKLSWDDQLPEDLNVKWQLAREQLLRLSQISLPRWLGCAMNSRHVSLHGFSDASERAYGASVYLRVEDASGNVSCNLVAAKTRVAPLNRLSIPRLELVAAELLHELIAYILPIFPNCTVIRAYSDSKIVLYWLREHPSTWATFIGNRTARILETLPSANWYHIGTKLNPADCASRGMMPNDLLNHSLWWNGPPFLLESPDQWPSVQVIDPPDSKISERRQQSKTCLHIVTDDDIPLRNLLYRYSSLNKLLRATAIIIRFAQRKKWSEFKNAMLTVDELNEAKLMWIRIIQRHFFKQEFQAVQNAKAPSKNGKLVSLAPFLIGKILRVSGRLSNSLLPFDECHPIIIPNKGQFTWLLIDSAHQRTLHGGIQVTMQNLRSSYWIIHPRRTVQNQIGNCILCYRQKAKVAEQIMGNLPDFRVQPSHPFYHTGVDFGGPYLIKTSSLRNAPAVKGYICLFTCLVTRAIHLELAEDLSTESFLAAMRRFVARRGLPGNMYADNGTNFVGAANLLPLLLLNAQNAQAQRIVNMLAEDGIQWHFIPPQAPHFGGSWEAGIKATKYHIKRIVGERRLLHIHFQTVLTQIEAVLNSRPLCQFHSEPEGWQLLTPGHFLIGRPLTVIPEPDLTQIPQNRLRAYQLGQQMAQHFWKVWSGEYLHRLQQRGHKF